MDLKDLEMAFLTDTCTSQIALGLEQEFACSH